MTELICIVCPKGCHLHVDEDNNFSVKGNACARGEDYGKTELSNPTRVLTSTVIITGGDNKRCPVKTNGAIPKGLIFEAMKLLDNMELKSPVESGEIVVKNICDTGIDFITTRAM